MKTVAEYSENNILVIPQSLFSMTDVVPLLHDGNSAIFYKNLEHDLVDVEFYTNTPCIIYIENGQETITTSENKTYELHANTAFFLPQGINLHSDYVQTSGNLKAYLIFFNDDVITDFLSTVKHIDKQIQPSELIKIKCGNSIEMYFCSIQLLKQNGINSRELVRVKLLELLHLLTLCDKDFFQAVLLSKNIVKSPKRNLNRLLTNADTSTLTISDLANLSGRSISTFTRDFKATFNMTPKKWLQDKRLSRAHELLMHTEFTVTHIALDLGYENVSHFIKSFKDKYKTTPKQLKQNN
ncbi:MAG: AraC family transcriptional regulator [Colwellia sp.]|nr:AraC family transcriptional regulator [Colwellia sp.]